MRIAVTSTGPELESQVDPRFGRCQYFLIVELDDLAFEAIENPNIAIGGGAGIQSAHLMSEKGAKVVLTGNCGPNAHATLCAAGIEVIVGACQDETFGHTLMFGLGGVHVEVFKDVAHRIVPISEQDAHEMIFETKGHGLLRGYRNKAKFDIGVVVSTLQNVGKLLEDFGDRILELDINPLIVYPEGRGGVVVDALIRIN